MKDPGQPFKIRGTIQRWGSEEPLHPQSSTRIYLPPPKGQEEFKGAPSDGKLSCSSPNSAHTRLQGKALKFAWQRPIRIPQGPIPSPVSYLLLQTTMTFIPGCAGSCTMTILANSKELPLISNHTYKTLRLTGLPPFPGPTSLPRSLFFTATGSASPSSTLWDWCVPVLHPLPPTSGPGVFSIWNVSLPFLKSSANIRHFHYGGGGNFTTPQHSTLISTWLAR